MKKNIFYFFLDTRPFSKFAKNEVKGLKVLARAHSVSATLHGVIVSPCWGAGGTFGREGQYTIGAK